MTPAGAEVDSEPFFLGSDASGITRLYESDGTVGGTVVVPGTSSFSFQNLLFSTGNQVVFFATGGSNIQVFSTDGTTVHSLFLLSPFPYTDTVERTVPCDTTSNVIASWSASEGLLT